LIDLALALLTTPAAVAPTPPREASVEAAVDVLRAYYAALDRHDYCAAYAIWTGGHDFAAFQRGYAHTAHVTVTPIPPFRADPGAGQVYAEIRVVVRAVLDNGTRQRFRGSYILHRVNDVDGSSAAERHWHIKSGRLRAF